MSRILLSVLMPTIPSRRATFIPLFDKLHAQAEGKPVEILALLDNKKRTIGAKCNALLDIARGKFLGWVDDDDLISDDFIDSILGELEANPDLDVLTYWIRCRLSFADGRLQENVVTPSVKFPNEEFHTKQTDVLRKPMQLAVWRSDFAKSSRWADAQYEADRAWAEPLWGQVKKEVNINRELYLYRWSETLTEAK